MINDPFFKLPRAEYKPRGEHSERKHSKFAASAATRWFACPGSIALSEGIPDKPSPYAEEGTRAHELLEKMVKGETVESNATNEMFYNCVRVKDFLRALCGQHPDADFLIEERVSLGFIHPEAYGTLDYAIVDYFGTLHILDFKYGMSFVSPLENLQFLFYALAVAHSHHWNFKSVRMWTLQPRVKNCDDGFPFWEIPIGELRKRIDVFEKAISDVNNFPNKYVEGEHCRWCRAQSICPEKQGKKFEKAKSIFTMAPV